MTKANVKMMTKQLADTFAKELAVRKKKVDGGIAGRRGQAKAKKAK